MKNLYNIVILLSFAGLWLTSYLSGRTEIILGFILIFSFGIIHGSNDLLLINSMSNSKTKYRLITVFLIYILTVLATVFTFYFFPSCALVLFILFSAFHFGEQHWEHHNLKFKKGLVNLYYLTYGMIVLHSLFLLNIREVIEVVKAITGYRVEKHVFEIPFYVSLISFGLLSLFFSIKSTCFKLKLLTELFYLIIFIIIFKVSTLIWGFAIYFIFWHSIPSLFEQIKFIYGDFNKNTVLKYSLKAFPFWLLSIIGIGIMYYIFKDLTMFYAVFFSFIAAVTFPHSIVISLMFLTKKNKRN